MRVAYAVALGVMACSADQSTQPSAETNEIARPLLRSEAAVVLIGAGDIAGCGGSTKDHLTAKVVDSVLASSSTARAFTAGDNAYPDGSAADFANCYHPTWGKFKARTWFTIGNHERSVDPTATAYYDYVLGVGVNSGVMGKRGKGYYAVNHGAWRIYLLNSEANISEQTAWLQEDLTANPRRCQAMIFHKPLHTTGSDDLAPTRALRPWHLAFWQHRGDVVVNGHSHFYRRTPVIRPDTSRGAPLERWAKDTATGYRLFVEGGGGHASLGTFGPPTDPPDEKQIRSWGVLKLTLSDASYAWQRLDTIGRVIDQGSRGCH
jgi:hypothetical protein